MSHTPHELAEQFPEHVGTIQKLKQENAHFAKLHDSYHTLNRAIHRAETNIEPTGDFTLEDMRKQRLAFLDEIAQMLKSAQD